MEYTWTYYGFTVFLSANYVPLKYFSYQRFRPA